MILRVVLYLSLVPPAPTAARWDDPPISVWLNHDNFQRGDRVRVHFRTAEDGYVVVLRSDAEGRIRVLFPLDPGDNALVHGRETMEVRSRGDREAFTVDERAGLGVLLAARTASPFTLEAFVRGDHWDYRALAVRGDLRDAEAKLVDLVQQMAGNQHFDYDVVTYTVPPRTGDRASAGYAGPFFAPALYGPPSGFRLRLTFGAPLFYRPFLYRPFLYRPFFYRAFLFEPFLYRPFFSRPIFYRPFFFEPFLYRPFFYRYRPVFYPPVWGWAGGWRSFGLRGGGVWRPGLRRGRWGR